MIIVTRNLSSFKDVYPWIIRMNARESTKAKWVLLEDCAVVYKLGRTIFLPEKLSHDSGPEKPCWADLDGLEYREVDGVLKRGGIDEAGTLRFAPAIYLTNRGSVYTEPLY